MAVLATTVAVACSGSSSDDGSQDHSATSVTTEQPAVQALMLEAKDLQGTWAPIPRTEFDPALRDPADCLDVRDVRGDWSFIALGRQPDRLELVEALATFEAGTGPATFASLSAKLKACKPPDLEGSIHQAKYETAAASAGDEGLVVSITYPDEPGDSETAPRQIGFARTGDTILSINLSGDQDDFTELLSAAVDKAAR